MHFQLSYLLSSLTTEILGQVTDAAHAADLWKDIQGTFSDRSCAHVINTRMALASTIKGALSILSIMAR
jgi:hypothetical protein